MGAASNQYSTVAQVIQWAANVAYEMLAAYENQHGFAQREDIWPAFTNYITNRLPDQCDSEAIPPIRQMQLMEFILDQKSTYHLEMSSDEMALCFLNAQKKE